MNPFAKIKDAALGTVRHPLGTTQKAVGQTVGLARGTAKGALHTVTGLMPGGTSSPVADPAASSEPLAEPGRERKTHGDPLAPASRASTARPRQRPRASGRTAPLSAAQVAAGEVTEVTSGADATGTDPQQSGAEPLVDPGTVKAVLSEAETLMKGADTDKG